MPPRVSVPWVTGTHRMVTHSMTGSLTQAHPMNLLQRCLPCRPTIGVLLPTPAGAQPWLKSIRLSSTMTHGSWFLGLQELTWCLANGFISISTIRMAPWLVTRQGGVVHGFSKQHGINYDKIFSHVVKSATIRTVLIVTISRAWLIHQLDVKNAFLHGHLNEMVY